MPKAPDAAPVTVKDRENAARVFDDRARRASHPQVILLERHHAKVIRAGEGDEYDAVQAARYARLAATSSDRARGEGRHADTEGEAVETWKHLNCPSCGGSGHIDDVNQAAEQRALAAEKERDEARMALEPVLHWYQSDEHAERRLAEIIADMAADLQHDRPLALRTIAAEQRALAATTMLEATGQALAETTKALAASEQRVQALVEAGTALADAEAAYRQMHDLKGDDSKETGRAWDLMRRASAKFRALFPAADGGSGEQG